MSLFEGRTIKFPNRASDVTTDIYSLNDTRLVETANRLVGIKDARVTEWEKTAIEKSTATWRNCGALLWWQRKRLRTIVIERITPLVRDGMIREWREDWGKNG